LAALLIRQCIGKFSTRIEVQTTNLRDADSLSSWEERAGERRPYNTELVKNLNNREIARRDLA
jgi:hypothetical protein